MFNHSESPSLPFLLVSPHCGAPKLRVMWLITTEVKISDLGMSRPGFVRRPRSCRLAAVYFGGFFFGVCCVM
jgi:hypothetical protein